MESRLYILVFDATRNPEVTGALHRYIMDSKDFVGYWNYIPLVYIVKSYETISVLREKLRYILTGGGFLLAEISSSNIDGLMPREAWDWFHYSHGQLSLDDLVRQAGENKATGGIGIPISGLGRALAGIPGDQTKK
jgi:hypothetical protein